MVLVLLASPTREPHRLVVKNYGRGGLLGLISPLFAILMARQGMNGWQQRAAREMQDDAVAIARQGYRVVSSEEYTMPLFNITYYKVTYELSLSPS
jgi:hypothetical protein